MIKENKGKLSKFGDSIPELQEVIGKWGCGLTSEPPFVIFGQFNSQTQGPIGGILAATMTEFQAYAILREVKKSGDATVEKTEFHPNPTFSIEIYKQKIREKIAQQNAETASDAPKFVLVSSSKKD